MSRSKKWSSGAARRRGAGPRGRSEEARGRRPGARGRRGRTSRRRRGFCQRSRGDDRSLDAPAATCPQAGFMLSIYNRTIIANRLLEHMPHVL